MGGLFTGGKTKSEIEYEGDDIVSMEVGVRGAIRFVGFRRVMIGNAGAELGEQNEMERRGTPTAFAMLVVSEDAKSRVQTSRLLPSDENYFYSSLYTFVPKTLNLFTPPSGMITSFACV